MNSNSPQQGFMVLHSNRMEQLVNLLAEFVAQYPLAPLAKETIIIQSNGMADWLNLQLAETASLGISAAIDSKMPSTFLWSLYRLVLGKDAVPQHSPFEKSHLRWRFYQLLPECTETVFAPLQQFLREEGQLQERKRLQLAEQLADLFDAYQMYRADWLEAWGQGSDQLRRALGREECVELPESQRWQPALWRKLLASMGEAKSALSRAAIHKQMCERLAAGQCVEPLPTRVMVFGVSALPQQVLEALALLSEHCQVVLFVHNPCEQYWADLVEDKHLLEVELRNRQRHLTAEQDALQDDLFASAEPERTHSLLAAWGKQGRDFISLLYRYDHPEKYKHLFENGQVDVFYHQMPTTVLEYLQQDILTLTPPCEEPREWHENDYSLRFSVGHSPQREVEILQDYLLGLFNRESDLAPRDVVVMVPNIEAYAPYIEATFGQLPSTDPRYLPYSIGDRSLGATLSMTQALDTLLSLPSSRFSNTEILDLLNVPAVQARFELTPTDVNLLERWVNAAGIRWGLTGEQRAHLGVPEFEQNTWLFGLRRMLAGYLMGETALWQSIAPYDEITGLDARVAGQLAHLLDRLNQYWHLLRGKHTPDAWGDVLGQLLSDFFLPQEAAETILDTGLRQNLSLWQDTCREAEFAEEVPLLVARLPIDETLENEGPSQRFLVGSISFCTLMPMRSIPFRHVCLLGMNDGDYPRQQPAMSFDLMRAYVDGSSLYRPGDRARRDDDRYLFLEALLSARDSLYISWVGRSQQDNTERPPSVLVAQLRDAIELYWQQGTSEKLTVEHAVQPFSERYYVQGEDRLPASYAKEWFALHQPQAGERPTDAPLSAVPLPLSLNVSALGALLRQPVEFFFTQRLGVDLTTDKSEEEETEPFAFDHLENWQIGNHLIQAALEGGAEGYQAAIDDQALWLKKAGMLPIGEFAELVTDPKVTEINTTATAYFSSLAGWQALATKVLSHPLSVAEQTVYLEGSLDKLYRHQQDYRRQRLVAGKIKDRCDKLVHDWVLHLLASAQGISLTTLVYGQDAVAVLPPITSIDAENLLVDLMEAYQAALREALPVACKTALDWLGEFEKQLGGKKPTTEARDKALSKARNSYDGTEASNSPKGEAERVPALKRCWPNFDAMFAPQLEEQSAFVYWAELLYEPLRRHCEFTQGGQV